MPVNSNHWRMTTTAIVFRFKAKILEQRMFKAINLWRNVKEGMYSMFLGFISSHSNFRALYLILFLVQCKISKNSQQDC